MIRRMSSVAPLRLERLESRTTPTAVYTYNDVDGDLVTVTSSKGTTAQLTARIAPAQMPFAGGLGFQLGNVTLTSTFDGADISITAKPHDANQDGTIDGDGFVNVGAIDIGSKSLGNVVVHGDLGRIIAGSSTNSTQLKSLTIQSLCQFGTATGAPNLVSTVFGNVGKLVVKGDIDAATFRVGSAGVGKIGSVAVGGSMLRGSLTGFDGIGSIRVKGSVLGGFIGSSVSIGSISIGGDLVGGRSNDTGMIAVTSSVVGATGAIARITIGGSVYGSDTFGANLTDTGTIQAVHIGSLTVGGSIVSGHVASGGSLVRSGSVHASDDIGVLIVKGGLIGNSTYPVLITARGQAVPTTTTDVAIKNLTVGGVVQFTSIGAGYSLNFRGLSADAQIGTIKVGGDWLASIVVAGLNFGGDGRAATNDDVLLHLADNFGDGPVKDGTPIAKIGNVAIGGQVLGMPGTDFTYGFGAEQVGSFRSGGVSLLLKVGAHNDKFSLGHALHIGNSLSAINGDSFAVHVYEV